MAVSVALATVATLACTAAAAASTSSPPPVSGTAAYGATPVSGLVYGQGLIYAGTAASKVVNLTLDAWVPSPLPGGPAVPGSPRPALMFVHGGGFSGSVLDKDKAGHITPDVAYFVARGFVGFQINYRLTEDNASFPQQGWPADERTGGAELGLQPSIAADGTLAASQRFRFVEGSGGVTGGVLALASNSELCIVARAPGGTVSMQPCPAAGAASNGSTSRWRVGTDGSFVGVGGDFDQKCLGTQAPSGGGPSEYKRAFVGRMAFRCDSSAPAQRWSATGLSAPGGGQICHPPPPSELALGPTDVPRATSPPVDSGCLSFAGGFQPPLSDLYPAVRDAKAAVRWIRAEGARRFGVDTGYITLAGGSAGACTILGAGVCQVQGDFATEIPLQTDPTLATTHLNESSAVRSMIVHWGAPFAVDRATAADPGHRSRYTAAGLPSIIAYNGLVDTTIPIEHILEVQREYTAANGTMVVRPLPGQPHACWNATVVVPGPDGKNRTLTMPEDAFAFIQRVQMLPPTAEKP